MNLKRHHPAEDGRRSHEYTSLDDVAAAMTVGILSGRPAGAQVTTATVAGAVKDLQGAVVPGATAVLISESRLIRVAEAITTNNGDRFSCSSACSSEALIQGAAQVLRSGCTAPFR